MIIDDNATNLTLASDVLELEGFRVVRCSDAEGALAAIGEKHPDLILTDIALPGIDGLELTRMLKANDTTRQIKIIALTAFAMKQDHEKALAAGCDGFITKPIDTRRFKDQITPYL
ncbi:two-component system, cell cycle response regulator DivK [Chryseolinea serpens]|uniref:Two-component system, cell cycle response regulator DivK n=2 Tax=Chryseolinea serpens TaxID=947013 RepID=A0A1M5P419_9BACT|nr:two-component system, cell cycle response regulator DivK [Chryseolinea serpens]